MCKQTTVTRTTVTVHFTIKIAFYTGFGNSKNLTVFVNFFYGAYKHKPIDQRPSDPKLRNK